MRCHASVAELSSCMPAVYEGRMKFTHPSPFAHCQARVHTLHHELLAGAHTQYRCVTKFWTHQTKFYCFCDRSVREKAWRSRKRVAQAT